MFSVHSGGDSDKILDNFVKTMKCYSDEYGSDFPRIQKSSFYTMRWYKRNELFLHTRIDNSLINIIKILGNELFTFNLKKQKNSKDDDISTKIPLKKKFVYTVSFLEKKEPFADCSVLNVEDLITNFVYLRSNEYILDYDESMKELSKIEDEIKTIQATSILYDF